MNQAVIMVAVLVGLCVLPLAIGYFLVLLPQKGSSSDNLLVGNSLLSDGQIPAHEAPVIDPLVHLIRSRSARDLKEIAQGLRHFPLHQTSALLQRLLLHDDPLLQIYSQTTLQERQETLQRNLNSLSLAAGSNEATQASFLEAGLALIHSPLTPSTEYPSILARLAPTVESVITSKSQHPRLIHAAALVCLPLLRFDSAASLVNLLPAGSPLKQDVAARLAHEVSVKRCQTLI